MLDDLMNFPNAKGFSPFHIACGAIQGSDEPFGPASLPVDVGSVESRPSIDDIAGDTSRELGEGRYVETTVDRDSRTKQTRLQVIEFLLSQGARCECKIYAPWPDRSTFCCSGRSRVDPHTDEVIVDMLVKAGADINAVDAQTRAGGGGPRYAPPPLCSEICSEELAWHLLRVDNALAHPATANPPALLLAAEAGVLPQ